MDGGSPVDVMLISDISKEPYLAFRYEQGNTQSMYGRITKSFVVETTSSVQPIKVSLIRFATKELETSNLEIREELAVVIVSAIVGIEQPVQVSIGVYQLRMRIDERASTRPERRKRAGVVENVHIETVLHVVITHESKNVIIYVTEEVDLAYGASV